MIKRLNSVPVFVSNMDRALEFYRDKLGFDVRADRPLSPTFRWLTVVPPNAETALQLFSSVFVAESDRGFREEVERRIGKWTGMVFLTDDMQSTYQTLHQRGVQFDAEPKQEPWGWEVWFQDPDGNRFALRQELARP